MDLIAHLISQHCLSCYPRAYRHDLYSNDPYLPIGRTLDIFDIEFGQETYIRVKSNTDAVNKKDWETRLGKVCSVPISEVSPTGARGTEEREGCRGKMAVNWRSGVR
jgi:hypothetical protein